MMLSWLNIGEPLSKITRSLDKCFSWDSWSLDKTPRLALNFMQIWDCCYSIVVSPQKNLLYSWVGGWKYNFIPLISWISHFNNKICLKLKKMQHNKSLWFSMNGGEIVKCSYCQCMTKWYAWFQHFHGFVSGWVGESGVVSPLFYQTLNVLHSPPSEVIWKMMTIWTAPVFIPTGTYFTSRCSSMSNVKWLNGLLPNKL